MINIPIRYSRNQSKMIGVVRLDETVDAIIADPASVQAVASAIATDVVATRAIAAGIAADETATRSIDDAIKALPVA